MLIVFNCFPTTTIHRLAAFFNSNALSLCTNYTTFIMDNSSDHDSIDEIERAAPACSFTSNGLDVPHWCPPSSRSWSFASTMGQRCSSEGVCISVSCLVTTIPLNIRICSDPDYEYELHIPFWSPHGAGGGISQVFTCTAPQTDVSHCNVFIRQSKPIRIKVVEYLMFGFRTCSPTFRLPTIPSLLCKCNILSPGKLMSSDS